MFDSTFEIRKKYPNLDINAITNILKYNSLNPKYQTCNGTHWCYGIKSKKESKTFLLKILNDLDNLPNINSKPVQNLETGDVYESATVAAIAVTGKENSNISCSAWYFSKGKNKIAFGNHWIYLEDINKPYTKEERHQLLKSLPYAYSSRMKTIQNLNTGKVYKGFKELKSALGLKDISGLPRACKCTKEGYNSIVYGYNWIYVEDKPYTKEECNNILKNLKQFTIYNAKKVINLETGEIFNSTAEADVKYSKKHNRTGAVLTACDKYVQGKSNIAHGYHWCYLDDIKDNSLECREKILLKCLNTKMPINNKRVQNLETGEVYNRYQDAGFEFIDNSVGAAELIGRAVRNTSNNCGTPVKGLYHYIRLEYNASPFTKQERIEILNSLDYSKIIMIKDLNRNIIFFSYQEVANYYNITRWEVDKYKIDPKYSNGLKLKFLSPDEIKEYFISRVK